MSRIIRTASLKVKSTEIRDKFFTLYQAAADAAWTTLPGTLRYCACKPYEDDDGVSLYVVEEFSDESAEHIHGSTQAVKDLLAFTFSTTDPIVDGEVAMHNNNVTLSTGEVYSYTRPTINDFPDAYIIFAAVRYLPGKTTEALPGWKEIVESCERDEESTLTYMVIEDKEENVMRTVEAYVDKNYARTVHMHGPAVKFNQEQNMSMRDGGAKAMSVLRGVKAAGFMGRA